MLLTFQINQCDTAIRVRICNLAVRCVYGNRDAVLKIGFHHPTRTSANCHMYPSILFFISSIVSTIIVLTNDFPFGSFTQFYSGIKIFTDDRNNSLSG